MDYLTMTNSETVTIFDEIVNCGILEEDSVVVFGAGHGDGKFLETLLEYNGSFEKGRITAIDVDSKKIKSLSRKFSNEEILFLETSLQNYIDSEPENSDWIVITGVFDNNLYGESQHDYVDSVVNNSLQYVDKGVMFSIKEEISENFIYSMLYFFVSLKNNYERVTIKKVTNGNYIFCIFKQ
jgi:hypothetical protein